jgi:hypothetical protein
VQLLDDRFFEGGDSTMREGILRVAQHPDNIRKRDIIAFFIPGGPCDLGR